jgi:hypothetical protein
MKLEQTPCLEERKSLSNRQRTVIICWTRTEDSSVGVNAPRNRRVRKHFAGKIGTLIGGHPRIQPAYLKKGIALRSSKEEGRYPSIRLAADDLPIAKKEANGWTHLPNQSKSTSNVTSRSPVSVITFVMNFPISGSSSKTS